MRAERQRARDEGQEAGECHQAGDTGGPAQHEDREGHGPQPRTRMPRAASGAPHFAWCGKPYAGRGVGSIIAKHVTPPPPGAGTALQWGEATYCEKMLGDAFELTITTHNTPQEEESGEAVWQLLSTSFGPIKTLLGNLPEERAQSFHDEMVGWLEEQRTGDVVRFDRVYHLVSGVRRS